MKTTFIYKQVNNCDIKGDFYPTNKENAPLLIYIHGGGLIWGSRNDIFKEQVELYNTNGFNVCSIDYRLAPETKLPEIAQDIEDALKWLLDNGAKEYDFNPEQIAMIGSSGGGYLALLTGTFAIKPKAIVSFYGYGSILGDWYTKPSPYFTKMTTVPEKLATMLVQPHTISEAPIERRYGIYLFCRQQGKWNDYVLGLNQVTNREKMEAYCPAKQVNSNYPATLLLHGDMDEDVPYEESVQMAKALDTSGVKHGLITIPNGKHVFDKEMDAPHVKEAFDQVISFLKENLGEQ